MRPTINIPAVVSDLTPKEQAAYLVPTLSALAEENRLAIALSLTDGAKTNKQLQEATGLSQALVSHHVAVLRKARLVELTAQGRSNLVSICCEQLAAPVQWLAHLATLTPEGQKACCTEAATPESTAVPDAD